MSKFQCDFEMVHIHKLSLKVKLISQDILKPITLFTLPSKSRRLNENTFQHLEIIVLLNFNICHKIYKKAIYNLTNIKIK